jgi:hypothetical protein
MDGLMNKNTIEGRYDGKSVPSQAVCGKCCHDNHDGTLGAEDSQARIWEPRIRRTDCRTQDVIEQR